MAISVVNRNVGGDAASSGTVTATFPSNTSGHAIIVIGVAGSAAASVLSTPTDTPGNTYSLIQTLNVNSAGLKVWATYNCLTSASTNTVSMGDGFNDAVMFIFEVAGLAASAAFDQTASAGQASATALSSGSTPTTAHANELLIGITSNQKGTSLLPTVGAGFSNLQTKAIAFSNAGSEEQIVAATGTYAATFGLAANTTNESTFIFTFSDTAGGTLHTSSLTGSLSFVGAEAKTSRLPLTATLSSSGSLTKAIAHKLTAGLSFAGTMAKTITRSLSGVLTSTGNVVGGHLHFLTLTATLRLNTDTTSYLSVKDINLTGTNIYAQYSNNVSNNSQNWEF